MNNPYRTLSSHLPARREPPPDALPADPKKLRLWLEGLPRANPQACLQALIKALDDLRERHLEGFARLDAMEVLRPMLLEASVLLTRQLQDSSFPLTGAKAEIAQQLLALQRELALAYRMAVVEACAPAGKVPFLRGTQVALALVRAAYHHVRWLATTCFMYRLPEAGNWAQLYALAAFASALGLDEKLIEDSAERRQLSVALLRNQAVLLWMANPYRFGQRDLFSLWRLSRDIAARISFTPERNIAAGALIRVASDTPPIYSSRSPQLEEGDVLWGDLRKLGRVVQAALAHAGIGGEAEVRLSREMSATFPVSLLEQVLEGWSQSNTDSFTTLGGGYELDSVLGLAALHFHAAGQQDFDSFMRQIYGSAHQPPAQGNTQNHMDLSRLAIIKTQVQEQSLGRYRLRWNAAKGVRIGELVGLALPGEQQQRDWLVGAVRWLRYDTGGGIEAGVDVLARRAQPASLRRLDASGTLQAPIRALGLVSLCKAESTGPAPETPQDILLIPSLTGLENTPVEVARNGDAWDFEQSGAPRIYGCSALKSVGTAGDYVLVNAAG